MSTRLCRFFILGIFVLIAFTAMTACGLPSRPTEVHYPYCLWPGDLGRADLEFPRNLEIIDDLTPTFHWYIASSISRCLHRGHHIEVSNFPGPCMYDDWHGDGWLVISETISTSRTVMDWTPTVPLEPTTMYHWRVAALFSDGVPGEYSTVECFFTGPICDSASLIAPELISPDDGAVVSTHDVLFEWSYSDSEECLPEGYLIELSTNPSFAGPNLFDLHGEYSDRRSPNTQFGTSYLEDCTEYYWRVTARVGSILGPTSDVWSFTTDFGGTCSDTSKSGTCDFDCECESEQGETEYTCPKDCPEHCGNGICDCGETSESCKKDCKLDCECGDGVCQPQCGETPNTCLADC